MITFVKISPKPERALEGLAQSAPGQRDLPHRRCGSWSASSSALFLQDSRAGRMRCGFGFGFREQVEGLGSRGFGFRGLGVEGFKGLGFMVLGFRGLGVQGFRG